MSEDVVAVLSFCSTMWSKTGPKNGRMSDMGALVTQLLLRVYSSS